jgi:hypothetical protein
VDVTVGASCVASCRPLDGCDCVQRASYECGEENPWTVAGIGPTLLPLGTTGLGEREHAEAADRRRVERGRRCTRSGW